MARAKAALQEQVLLTLRDIAQNASDPSVIQKLTERKNVLEKTLQALTEPIGKNGRILSQKSTRLNPLPRNLPQWTHTAGTTHSVVQTFFTQMESKLVAAEYQRLDDQGSHRWNKAVLDCIQNGEHQKWWTTNVVMKNLTYQEAKEIFTNVT